MVTIPKDFSAHATSYSDQSGDTAEQAVLDVQTSQVSGVSDPVVGQAITAAATRALNSQLTEQYVKNIYVGFNDTGKQFTKVADAAGQLSDGTSKLADGLGQTSDRHQAARRRARPARRRWRAARQAGRSSSAAASTSTPTASARSPTQTSALPKGGRQIADGVEGIESGLKTYQKALRQQAGRRLGGEAADRTVAGVARHRDRRADPDRVAAHLRADRPQPVRGPVREGRGRPG